MERIIEKNVRPLLDKVRDEQEEALSVEYEKEDLDEMIREVINEYIHSNETKKSRDCNRKHPLTPFLKIHLK